MILFVSQRHWGMNPGQMELPFMVEIRTDSRGARAVKSCWQSHYHLGILLIALATATSSTYAQGPGATPLRIARLPATHEETYQEDNLQWWTSVIRGPMRSEQPLCRITREELLVRALQHSAQIRVFSELPLIRETAIVEADAAFDWTAFLRSRWDDLSDPVGNTLTVGPGATRFLDNHWTNEAGVRKRNRYGGAVDIRQELGFQDTNSQFFQPDPQGTSRIVVGYTHPLMRGRGRIYNESLIVLAQLDTRIAQEELSRQLQAHLLEVVRAYWGLYLERGAYAQKLRSFQRAEQVLSELQGRRELDAMEVQIVSAEAEVARRASLLQRSAMAVKNAEDRIRALVNDPSLGNAASLELIPVDEPTTALLPISMDEALATALQMRPEVNQALKQIQAACVRVNMSKNEALPMLNLVTEAYVAGLQGEGNIGRAWSDQFSRGQPSYSIGLQYERPVGNRAARRVSNGVALNSVNSRLNIRPPSRRCSWRPASPSVSWRHPISSSPPSRPPSRRKREKTSPFNGVGSCWPARIAPHPACWRISLRRKTSWRPRSSNSCKRSPPTTSR